MIHDAGGDPDRWLADIIEADQDRCRAEVQARWPRWPKVSAHIDRDAVAAWDGKAPPIDGEVRRPRRPRPSSGGARVSRNLRIRSAVLGTDCRPRLARCAGGIDPCHEAVDSVPATPSPIAGSRISCPGGMVPKWLFIPYNTEHRVFWQVLELEIDLGRGSLRHVVEHQRPAPFRFDTPSAVGLDVLTHFSSRPNSFGWIQGFRRRSHSPSTTRPTAGTVRCRLRKLLMCPTSAPSSE